MPKINNDFYEELGAKWHCDWTHPIAFLRKENETRNPWILQTMEAFLGKNKAVLDIGCGGGFLSNALSRAGHRVTGIDLSSNSLEVAKAHDATGTVNYVQANALDLPYPAMHFDAVCAMDLLEHVEHPKRVVQEAARVLKKGGLFFFHTFNRNWLSWLIVIKAMEWWVPNTPKNLHVYSLFIKPQELFQWCAEECISVQECRGLNLKFLSKAFLKSCLHRRIAEDIEFQFTSSLKTGYIGFGIKDV